MWRRWAIRAPQSSTLARGAAYQAHQTTPHGAMWSCPGFVDTSNLSGSRCRRSVSSTHRSTDGRSSTWFAREVAGGRGPRVRAVGRHGSQLGPPSRRRRGPPQRRDHDLRPRGALLPEAGEQAAPPRAGHPKKPRPGSHRRATRSPDGIRVRKGGRLPIRAMCRVLGLSTSGYYAWLGDRLSARARRDDAFRVQVRKSWEASRRTYGRPRIHADLKAQGERVAPKRVACLMREERIEGHEPAASQGGHHGAGRRRSPRARPGRPKLPRRRAGQALGRRHHLRAHRCRLAVRGRGGGRLEPWGRGLGDGDAPARRTRRAGLGDVERAPGSGDGDPPLRPGHAVHVLGVRSTVRGSRRAAFDGLGGRCLRQRDVRELLGDARVRAARPLRLRRPDRAAPGGGVRGRGRQDGRRLAAISPDVVSSDQSPLATVLAPED